MRYIDELYENYLDTIRFSSSGDWCKPVKNQNSENYHPEPYTKEEFNKKLKTDTIFAERWVVLK